MATFHCLHGEQLSHRFRKAIDVVSDIDTLLGEHLDLGSSAATQLLAVFLTIATDGVPVLKPDLDGTLRHADLRSNPLTSRGIGSRVFAEFGLKRN